MKLQLLFSIKKIEELMNRRIKRDIEHKYPYICVYIMCVFVSLTIIRAVLKEVLNEHLKKTTTNT